MWRRSQRLRTSEALDNEFASVVVVEAQRALERQIAENDDACVEEWVASPKTEVETFVERVSHIERLLEEGGMEAVLEHDAGKPLARCPSPPARLESPTMSPTMSQIESEGERPPPKDLTQWRDAVQRLKTKLLAARGLGRLAAAGPAFTPTEVSSGDSPPQ